MIWKLISIPRNVVCVTGTNPKEFLSYLRQRFTLLSYWNFVGVVGKLRGGEISVTMMVVCPFSTYFYFLILTRVPVQRTKDFIISGLLVCFPIYIPWSIFIHVAGVLTVL